VPMIDNSVVALSDGSVMVARPGTISRDVIDWFNSRSAGPKQFDIGRQPFVPNSDLPQPEAEVRLARFATELKANPEVNAKIFVCSSGDDAANRELAAGRARRLKKELVAKRIDDSRISIASCVARAAAGRESERDGQIVGIALSRGG
jgi:outer membrane protein OmpA-like peptidoglycan-associated protein